MFWYMSDPFKMPLIAKVYLGPGVLLEQQSLSELGGAYDADAVRPPIVDELGSEAFGQVTRVVRYTKDESSGRLIMHVSFIGQKAGFVVMIDAATPDLDYGTLAIDDLAALMESCVFGDDGTGD